MSGRINKESVRDMLLLVIGALIYSVGTQSFIVPANIAPGGAVGIALMMNYVTGLPVGRMTLLVNLPLLVLAWFYLSRRFALRTAVACGICSIILDYVVAPICPVYAGDRMMRGGRIPVSEKISPCPNRACSPDHRRDYPVPFNFCFPQCGRSPVRHDQPVCPDKGD